MDEQLDLTEKMPRSYETGPFDLVDVPITIPVPKFGPVPPPERVADGRRARRATTMPPPIPAAALRKSAEVIAPVVEPSVLLEPPSKADPEPSVEVDLSEPSEPIQAPSALPPLPSPS